LCVIKWYICRNFLKSYLIVLFVFSTSDPFQLLSSGPIASV
jgi:lipopolysaccharide export LptBFGC system permease protein LptF